jgi:hypothetical protein
MTNCHLEISRTAGVALVVLVIVCVPLTNVMAQQQMGDRRNASGDLAVGDGTEFLTDEDESAGRRMVRNRLYPRSNYLWPYAFGPNYPSVDVNAQGVVWTPAGPFQLQDSLPIAGELRIPNQLGLQDAKYFIVQYNTELAAKKNIITTIERNGGKVIQSVVPGTIIALMTQSAHVAAQSALGVIAVEPFHGAFKLDPNTALPSPRQ